MSQTIISLKEKQFRSNLNDDSVANSAAKNHENSIRKPVPFDPQWSKIDWNKV